MASPQLIIAGAVFLFLVVFLSGFWLRRGGKPYQGVALTIHKLVSVAAAVCLVVVIYRANQPPALGTAGFITAGITGLLFLGAGVSGALLSIDKPLPPTVLRMHRITPALALLSTAATLLLLPGLTP
jgi:hypothetical protein